MTPAQTYRAQAAIERHAAATTSLPNRRAMHERAAMAWEEMADRAEDTAIKAAANAAAKVGG